MEALTLIVSMLIFGGLFFIGLKIVAALTDFAPSLTCDAKVRRKETKALIIARKSIEDQINANFNKSSLRDKKLFKSLLQ